MPGEWGFAASGTRAERSISIISSYCASSSAFISTHWSPLPIASMNLFVFSSEGKMDVVHPVSVPMLVTVALSGTDNVARAGPKYSRM